jgi:hypothetical protein
MREARVTEDEVEVDLDEQYYIQFIFCAKMMELDKYNVIQLQALVTKAK